MGAFLSGGLDASAAAAAPVNSIDRDGVMGGYDLELIAQVREAISLPMTVLGGAGERSGKSETMESSASIASRITKMTGLVGRARGLWDKMACPSVAATHRNSIQRCGTIPLYVEDIAVADAVPDDFVLLLATQVAYLRNMGA